ncbi:GNAT family N-acetyltransferase [uncultured Algimonas sp.]|uniref:GNAT family N-acetyltransferase n=1 Tax=uncultured Algimonas sp. TaxID=1547920 RepID=UPI00261B8EB7|nr:GNAT family N-acetyltransferase [uncultured Algimonas sp.]
MPPAVDIRRNDRAALPRFAALNAEWIEELHHLEESDKAMVARPELYLENGGQVFSAHLDGRVVGACALKPHVDGPKAGQWELTKMAVDRTARGHGIGQKLMDAVHAYARDRLGLRSIFLLSNTRNDAALRLYARNGWTVNHEGPHPIYARCNIGMEKML